LSLEDNTTLERVRQILAKEFEVASELIQPSARLDQLAIDSLAVIDVMFQLEDEFKISFPKDPGEMPTVGDLVSCIDRLAAEQTTRAPSGAAAP
jgi:acyl carrier protein